jgi:fructosamine-3-kinase
MEAVLIDPAVSYSDREVELAFIELFGGFPPGFLASYAESYPVDDGYDYRRPALQLYPLLVHLNHFGEQYGPAVDDVLDFYLR